MSTRYRVTYEYQGRRQVTELPYRPGERIRVRVDVTPAESVNDLFVMSVWAVSLLTLAARITFAAQRAKLALAMQKLRQGLVPAALILAGFAPFTQAHSMPGPVVAGVECGRTIHCHRSAARRDFAR